MSLLDGGADIFEWMALRRVHDGGVSTRDGSYRHYGRQVVGDVAHALDRLLHAGHLVLRQPGPDGHRAVCVTVAGQVRYAQLQDGCRG